MKKCVKLCNNCGKSGHKIFECNLPSISIGIILFRIKNNKREYLMIRRNTSFGYMDIIKKKKIYDLETIQNIINELTIYEKEYIIEKHSQEKKDNLNNDTQINFIETVENALYNSNTSWLEPEWGFPKGKRNPGERDLDCAIREFTEETGYSFNDIHLIENVLPYEEIFVGSNNKLYKQKYYLAFNSNNIDILDKYQRSEVSKIDWLSLDDCIKTIRDYNIEKINLIKSIDSSLEKYSVIKI
jgi:8-oxo-dGTP pyrophosphatase MutT (NUDIX family)